MTVDKNKKRLSESREAKLTALMAMGKSERQALEFIAKDEMALGRAKASPTTSRPVSPSTNGKRTIKMTQSEHASFEMLKGMGRSEKNALEFIEKAYGHKFTEHGDARVTFANLSFKPHRSAK